METYSSLEELPLATTVDLWETGGANANSIACINSNITEWSVVVYNVSIDAYIPIQPPPTVEPCEPLTKLMLKSRSLA